VPGAGPRGPLFNPAAPRSAKRWQILNTPVWLSPTWAAIAAWVAPAWRSPMTCRRRSSWAAAGSLRMSTCFMPPM